MRIRAGVLAVFLSGLIFPAAAFADCSDYPDPYYEDINGDGIDGDTAIAVFVSGAAGNDANPGTMLSPVATIARGIFLADSTGRAHVYVAGGTYIGTVSMADGVSLYGQYDGPPGWGRSGANTTTVSDTGTAVLASNITVETHLEGFAIVSTTNASERTGFGIRVVNGNGPLYVRYNSVMPGTGLDGQAGGNGGPGTNGGPGGPGGEGVCNGFGPGPGGAPGFSACGRNGGMGGQGGSPGNNGQPGNPGNIGTPGGPPGPSGDPGLAGGNGGNGTSGANGADGAGGSGYTITGGGYAASEGLAGTSGSAGNGGGGGGGGGGQNSFFPPLDGSGNGGGGGGGAGCAGAPGTGGQGGGGSIGILIHNASAVVDGNAITTGAGGNGGNGGIGGNGGVGGPGGPGGTDCLSEVGRGGNGGNGGNGGRGGHGGGGAGGASIGILVSTGVSVTVGSTNIFNVGAGGAGGSSPGVSGAPGISAPIVGAATEATPSITLVSPDSGEAGDTVTILGSNFGPTPADNKVCFGLGQAAVLSANTDSLTVEVPAGASSGRIKVTVDSLETYSPAFFTVGSGCAGAKGDMNASGGLSPADVVLMLNCVFLASGSCDLCFADVNCSGGLSPADVVIELNMVFLGAGAGC